MNRYYIFPGLFFVLMAFTLSADSIDEAAQAFDLIAGSVTQAKVDTYSKNRPTFPIETVYAGMIIDKEISPDELIAIFRSYPADDVKKMLKNPTSNLRSSNMAPFILTKESLFHTLIQLKQTEVVNYILDNKLIDDLNAKDKNNFNPLMLAVIYGDLALVDNLLKKGANPNVIHGDIEKISTGEVINNATADNLFDVFPGVPSVPSNVQTSIEKLILNARKGNKI